MQKKHHNEGKIRVYIAVLLLKRYVYFKNMKIFWGLKKKYPHRSSLTCSEKKQVF